MASTACFVIVGRNDSPIYESEVGTTPKKDEATELHQFILHAALDIVQDVVWTTNAMFLKVVDRFSDLLVSVYVTAGHTRLMLLHDSRNEDGIKNFFQEVHELYIKERFQLMEADQIELIIADPLKSFVRSWISNHVIIFRHQGSRSRSEISIELFAMPLISWVHQLFPGLLDLRQKRDK